MITEIKFECPHCGQRIAVESDAAGLSGECPTCQNSVTIPHSVAPPAPRRKGGSLREKLAAAQSENERLRSNATLAQAEIKSFHNERLTLRSEAASLRQRAATSEARLGAMQGELDLQRQRLEATETQLAAAGRELSESRAAAQRAVGERTAAEQEIACVRSELAAALAAFGQSRAAADAAEARVVEMESQLAWLGEKLAAAEAEALSLQTQSAAARGEVETLRGLMDKDEAGREFLSTKTKLAAAVEELRERRQSAAQLEAELLASEKERRRLDEERSAMHRRVSEALKQAEDLSKDRLNADNEKLRELLERQNEELKIRFRELTRFRRAKLALKIIWALTALGITGLGYVFLKILPTIEWAQ